MHASYIPNDEVIAYTGEKGEQTYGSDYVTTISGEKLYGFKNSEGGNFVINGHYSGGENLTISIMMGIQVMTIEQLIKSPMGK